MKKTLTRILALLLILCLLVGAADAGTRIGSRRALLGIGEEIGYLLRATFTASDQGYSDGQVVDDPSEGIEDGQLTIVEVDGTLAVSGTKCAFTAQGTPAFGDLGLYSQAVTKALGRGLLGTVSFSANNKLCYPLIWGDNSGVAVADWIYTTYFTDIPDIRVQVFDGAGGNLEYVMVASTYSIATDYQVALVLGGYDGVAGVPWRSGQAAASYLYGAAVYFKGGVFTNWTLLWRTSQSNATTLYAMLSNYSATGTLDNFRVPDADLSAVLQPNNLSTFTADNGTSLDAITPEVGGGWTEQSGDWDIQSNKAEMNTEDTRHFATVDSGISDGISDVIVRFGNSNSSIHVGIVLRYSDTTHHWLASINEQNNTVDIYEVNGGYTQRATAAVTINAATDYDVRAIYDGQTIDAFLDSGNKISYGSAALNETATIHGVAGYYDTTGGTEDDQTFDNFAIYARTSSVYEAVLDSY